MTPGRASARTAAAVWVGGERDVRAQATDGRLARELGADDRRRPEQPIETANVDRDEIGARELVARGKFLRERRQRDARVVSRPRLIDTREHRRPHARGRESPALRCPVP